MAMMAVPPIQVSTVPWVPTSPATPHYSWNGNQIRLKGTANVQDSGGGNILYDWNPGDGGTHCTGVVTNMYIIECVYTYAGSVGTVYNATLTVYDSTTTNGGSPPTYSNSGSASYYTEIYAPPPSLQTETNAAIDAGLWYLHKDMYRYSSAQVTTLTLTNGGSGYESDGVTLPVVTFAGCSTSPAATPTVVGGVITALTLTSAGGGCVAPVTVTITDPIVGGAIIPSSISITNTGTGGYLYPCCSDVYAYFTGAGNTGASAYGYVAINATAAGGINTGTYNDGIYMYNNGTGYASPVAITFTDYYCSDNYYSYYASYGYSGSCFTGGAGTANASPLAGGSGATATATVGPTTNLGDWSQCTDNADNCIGYSSGITAANCTAFEVSGHLEGGPAADPYTDDVQRCLLGVYSRLMPVQIPNSITNGVGTFDPDQNGNGLGVTITESEDMYQDGMIMDALIATGTANKAVTYGPLALLTHPGGNGPYTYGDTTNDMSDYYVYCETQGNSASSEGSWRYTCNSGQDNSVAQWAAIGLVGASRNFGSSIPADALGANVAWLGVSQQPGFPTAGGGYFGYTSSSPIWGPYADTPSGMVQMALNGIGRGTITATGDQWDWAESFERDNFDNPQIGNSESDMKDYYYGMFSFTKSMLLHSNASSGGGITPIQYLHSTDQGGTYPDIDWYAAQNASYGGTATSNGVARTLISGTPANGIAGQGSDGSWTDHSSLTSDQWYFETAWAIIMLNHTVFQQVPTACGTATPNPATDGTSVQLSGQCSTDPNPAPVQITTWQWDISGVAPYNNYALNGVKVNATLTAPATCALPCSYPVGLQVTDSLGLSSTVVVIVTLTNPTGAVPPVANAGGPYNFCPNESANGTPIYTPWYLNGSASSQANGYVITAYNWDFSCSGAFTSATGVQPRVDVGPNNLFNHNSTPFNVCLQVTNNTGIAQDTYSVASAQVTVHSPTDPECSHCVATQSAKAKNFTPGNPGDAQIYWIDTNTSPAFPIDHYNIYRSSNASFTPFIQVAGASGHYPAVKAQAGGGEQLVLIDGTIPAPSSQPYYYRIAPATTNDTETCASPITLSVVVGGRQ